jgi:hypothetical protein
MSQLSLEPLLGLSWRPLATSFVLAIPAAATAGD